MSLLLQLDLNITEVRMLGHMIEQANMQAPVQQRYAKLHAKIRNHEVTASQMRKNPGTYNITEVDHDT